MVGGCGCVVADIVSAGTVVEQFWAGENIVRTEELDGEGRGGLVAVSGEGSSLLPGPLGWG